MKSSRLTLFHPLLTASHLKPKKIFLNPAPRRSIVHIVDLKGLHPTKPTMRHLSIFDAAIFHHLGISEKFYQLSKISSHNPSACNKLMMELFFQRKQNDHFGFTRLPTLPAYYLTPHWFSQIIYHLDQGTLEKEKENIASSWHKSIYEMKPSDVNRVKRSRVNQFLETLIAAKKETINAQYPAFFVEKILMSFILDKASSRSELMKYLMAIDTLNKLYDSEPIHEEKFDSDDITKGITILNNIKQANTPFETLLEHYEAVVAAIFLQKPKLPHVAQSRFGYRRQPIKSNCFENLLHNLSNIILYDGKRGFDLNKLSTKLEPNPELLRFYQEHDTIYVVNLETVRQAFYNLVSGIQDKNIQYRQKDYGLKATPESFIPLMNYLYGTSASSLEELSQQFSDDKREIIFAKKKNVKDKTIIITFKTKNEPDEEITLCFTESRELGEIKLHCNLDATRFNQSGFSIPSFLGNHCLAHIKTVPLFYPLILKNTFLTSAAGSAGDNFFDPNVLPYHMNYFFPENIQQAYGILHQSRLKQPIEIQEHYARYCNQQFPQLLALAVYNNNSFMTEFLLKTGANVNIKSYSGYPSLFYDCRNMQMVKLLLNAGLPLHTNDESNISLLPKIVKIALEENDVEFVSKLIRSAVNPNMIADGLPLIFWAKSQETVALLLAAGSKISCINEKGETPLFHATTFEIAQLFLKNGADILAKNNEGKTALPFILRLAIENDATDFVDNVIKTSHLDLSRPLVCHREPSPYSVLLFANSLKMTQLLLDAGANPNVRDPDDNTPLSRAANSKIAKALLDKGARWDDVEKSYNDYYCDMGMSKKKYLLNTFFKDKQKKNIINLVMIGIRDNDIEFVNYLIKKRVLPYNEALKDGILPFGLCQSVEMVKLLIQAGENPNKRNFLNENALFQVSHPDVAWALLEAGTDYTLVSNRRMDFLTHLKNRNEEGENLAKIIEQTRRWIHNKEDHCIRLRCR